MPSEKLRRQIAWEAARLIVEREESTYHRAKIKAALRICKSWVHNEELPDSKEILEQVQLISRLNDTAGDGMPRDRFRIYGDLLRPLAEVRQNRQRHPEGDVLHHSLQVFDLACQELPYDEEFLTAALLHDVGKAIDPANHVAAALAALANLISERTAWFIAHHPEGRGLIDGSIGARARRRLEDAEDYEELRTLAVCDLRGRRKGVVTSELDDALQYIRELAGE